MYRLLQLEMYCQKLNNQKKNAVYLQIPENNVLFYENSSLLHLRQIRKLRLRAPGQILRIHNDLAASHPAADIDLVK